MTLQEYASQNKTATQLPGEAESMNATGQIMQDAATDYETGERLKDNILKLIQAGEEPQLVLYTAVKCISSITHDPEYLEAGTASLNSDWADLAQQSLTQNNAAIAAQRAKKKQLDLITQTINGLIRKKAKFTKVINEIDKEIDALNELKLDYT